MILVLLLNGYAGLVFAAANEEALLSGETMPRMIGSVHPGAE